MTKCPYTPPHAWNVDVPHLMLRAKAVKFKNGAVGAGERSLAKSAAHTSAPLKNGERTPGKVAIFSTCYINYNEPGIGMDLLAVLSHHDIAFEIVNKEKCCGMPKLELGDLEGVAALASFNLPVLAKYALDGYAILTAIPSCRLMFKQEIPLLLADNADAQLVKAAMWEPFE